MDAAAAAAPAAWMLLFLEIIFRDAIVCCSIANLVAVIDEKTVVDGYEVT